MNHISPKELKKQLSDPDIFLLDVREPYEHSSFNIGGILIPLGEIIGQAKNIPTNKPVIVYCEKGIRSQIAIQRLQEKFGFTNLVNLAGGMRSWKEECKLPPK